MKKVFKKPEYVLRLEERLGSLEYLVKAILTPQLKHTPDAHTARQLESIQHEMDCEFNDDRYAELLEEKVYLQNMEDSFRDERFAVARRIEECEDEMDTIRRQLDNIGGTWKEHYLYEKHWKNAGIHPEAISAVLEGRYWDVYQEDFDAVLNVTPKTWEIYEVLSCDYTPMKPGVRPPEVEIPADYTGDEDDIPF